MSIQIHANDCLQGRIPKDSIQKNSIPIQCPISFVLEVLSGKWSILILRELFHGERRTSQLLTALPGISTKTLTQRLRNLEHHGLLERRVYAEVPPRVDYRLTERGRELQPVLGALRQVGQRWLNQPDCQCPGGQ